MDGWTMEWMDGRNIQIIKPDDATINVQLWFRSSVAERATVNREVEGSMPSGTGFKNTRGRKTRPLFCKFQIIY